MSDPRAAAGVVLTLDLLPVGQAATIVDIEGDDLVSVRLMEMGLLPDQTIECLGLAPLGDPMEFLIRGYRLSLRKSEARRVQISSATGPA